MLIIPNILFSEFQFGWIGSPDFANAITLSDMALPSLIIYNSTTRHHHFPEEKPYELTPESITLFLEAVKNQSVKVIQLLYKNFVIC